MPLKWEDTERALLVMEACHSAGDEVFRVTAKRLLHVFQSDLFQALLGVTHKSLITTTSPAFRMFQQFHLLF
ncbi:disks large-like 4 [Silurus asotus]|uniref:Disks large-like 4 n=1 Tax=Silurus asotus TaxID=30991 RepID=A0AAD5A3L0_SILAS|nr:disks large-like 4 [Silurus asotus]